MTKIEFTIPDAKVSVLVAALCKAYNYQEEIEKEAGEEIVMIKNPETKAAFSKRMTVEFWKNHAEAYEVNKAKDEARENLTLTTLDVT